MPLARPFRLPPFLPTVLPEFHLVMCQQRPNGTILSVPAFLTSRLLGTLSPASMPRSSCALPKCLQTGVAFGGEVG